MFECFYEIIRDLLPSKDLPTPIWIARLTVLFCLGSAVAVFGYYELRNTAIGDRLGIRPEVAILSQHDFIQLQEDVHGILAQAHDEGQIDSIFWFMGFDEKSGDFTYLDRTNAIALTVPFPGAVLISRERLNDLFQAKWKDYKKTLLSDRSCTEVPLSLLDQKRLRLILLGLKSDRIIICPLINPAQNRVFGAILATRIGKDQPTEFIQTYADRIRDRILWQPRLSIRDR